ncbi:MAG: enoyl-CoA hydratase/isomerase family protein [Haliscomenobacter sp.]|nr:enoyl-CoA hydratase/isomerase family protein [Haliscomenobacter sp.]
MENRLEEGTVETHVADGIATIAFSHPAQNSLPGRLLALLATAIEQAGSAGNVRVIILKSGGDRTFCAGASFDELSAIQDLDSGKRFFLGFARVINAMRKCPKLIIGRVQGKAVGGGVGLAAAADYCLATRAASVKLSELAVGIGPFVVGPAVARKIGESAMSQLAIDATEWRTAEWAYAKGLYAGLYDDPVEMDAAVEDLARKLSSSSPEAMHELKSVFWQGTQDWDLLLEARAEISGRLVLSSFTKEAIARFKEKKA